MDVVYGHASIDDQIAMRLAAGQFQEPLPGLLVELVRLRFQPVRPGASRIARTPALADQRIDVHQNGQIWDQAVGSPERDPGDLVPFEVPTGPLIGDGGIDVAVGDDNLPPLQRGPHQGRHVVSPIGCEQQCLCARTQVVAVTQQQFAQPDAHCRRTRLASEHDLVALVRAQPIREHARLSGLARAVTALERDEDAVVASPDGLGTLVEPAGPELAQILQQPRARTVVHLLVGDDAERDHQQRRDQEDEGRAVVGERVMLGELDRVLADQRRQRRTRREHRDQDDPRRRGQEGERPAAHGVVHGEPEQGVPGHPGNPAARTQPDREQEGHHHVGDQGDRAEEQPGRDQRQPEQPEAREPGQHPGAAPHASGQAEEHRGEQRAVARLSSTQVAHITGGQADHEASRRECAEHADDQPADQRCRPDELPAVHDRAQHRLVLALFTRRALGNRQPRDHQAGDDEGGRVHVQRQVDRVGLQALQEVVQHAVEQADPGERQCRDRRGAIGGDQAHLVGCLEPVARHQVRNGGFLGGHPEQGETLDQQGGDIEPPQGADQRNADEQQAAQDVTCHHHELAVQPVRDRTGQRPEHDGGREPQDQHARNGQVLGRVRAIAQVLRQRRGREQAQPITEAGAAQGEPEPAERGDP